MSVLPQRPDCAPYTAPLVPVCSQPSKEELRRCLEDRLPELENYLKGRFPGFAVLDAVDKAKGKALEAIFGDLHDRMPLPPEKMTSASRRRWLHCIARNAAVDILRGEQRRKKRQKKGKKKPIPLDQIPAPSTSWIDLQERELLHKAVGRLPADLQAVIVAMDLDGLSSWKTAARLGVPQRTVWNRRNRAIRLLRDEFEKLAREI